MDGLHHNVDPALRLTSMNLIGRYAVNLGFSDGHDRGVYPWSLLAQLAARPTIDDFITAAAPDPAPTPADGARTFMTPTTLAETSPANLEG